MVALSAGVAGLHATTVCPTGTAPFLSGNSGQVNCIPVTVSHSLSTLGIAFTVFSILLGIFTIVCDVKIITKAGYSGWYVLTAFVPILNIVMFFIFVFGKWPIQERLERAERGMGRGYPPPSYAPESPGSGGGPWGDGAGPAGPSGGPGGGPGPGAGVGPGAPMVSVSAGSVSPAGSLAQQGSMVGPGPVAVALGSREDSGVIYCSWCGKQRAVDAQAIHHCGSKDRPVVHCMQCGTPLEGALHCASCGTPATQISQ